MPGPVTGDPEKKFDSQAHGEPDMRWPRAPYWVWVPLALTFAPILLIAVGELRKFVDRRSARFMHFKTLDSAREERLMLDVPVPATFSSWEEMDRVVARIKVPGYGASGSMLSQPDGSIIWLECVEIQGRGKDRCLVFREVEGKLVKLDDFVYDTNSYGISNVRSDGDRLSYEDWRGRTVPVVRLGPK
jgi:hypothetical protein